MAFGDAHFPSLIRFQIGYSFFAVNFVPTCNTEFAASHGAQVPLSPGLGALGWSRPPVALPSDAYI